MEDVVSDKLLDRIRKLWAKAESAKAIGSVHEAEAFAEAVQRMLVKYKLEMSALEMPTGEDPIEHGWVDWEASGLRQTEKRIAWLERLASAVAIAHFSRIVVQPGSNRIMFVGRAQDRQIAEYVFVTLVREGERQANAGYWRERYKAQKQGHYSTGGYKSSFLYGFVTRIQERYAELRREQQATPGMALVLKRAGEELTAYLRIDLRTKAGRGVNHGAGSNSDAIHDGRSAANNANLSGNGLGAGATANGKGVKAPAKALPSSTTR